MPWSVWKLECIEDACGKLSREHYVENIRLLYVRENIFS